MNRLTIIVAAFMTLSSSVLLFAEGQLPVQAATQSTTSLYNCTLLQVRPANIVLTCADSNRYIKGIKWRSWTSKRAEATGTLYWNGCSPACYDGKWHSMKIQFSALDPKTVLTHRIFTELYGPSGAWGSRSRLWVLPTKPL